MNKVKGFNALKAIQNKCSVANKSKSPFLNKDTQLLWQLAQQFMRTGQFVIGGLISSVIFESIIKKFESNIDTSNLGKNPSFNVRINNIKNKLKIDENLYSWLLEMASPDSPRNKIIHPPEGHIPDNACHDMFKYLSKKLSTDKLNYEELAAIERELFGYMWATISGELPDKISISHFDNLVNASEHVVAPIGAYLEKHCPCIKSKSNKLSFASLSRVNATSGYVWLAALKRDGELRARIRLPSLTVLFKPSGISVYVELPGRSHEGKNYKKKYYQMLLDGRIDKYLTVEMANNGYEFFNALWYAEREPICTIDEYICNKEKIKEINNFYSVIQNRIEQTNFTDNPITGNSFLVGKFYNRKECIGKYCTNIHEEISHDFMRLLPLLNAIYE